MLFNGQFCVSYCFYFPFCFACVASKAGALFSRPSVVSSRAAVSPVQIAFFPFRIAHDIFPFCMQSYSGHFMTITSPVCNVSVCVHDTTCVHIRRYKLMYLAKVANSLHENGKELHSGHLISMWLWTQIQHIIDHFTHTHTHTVACLLCM